MYTALPQHRESPRSAMIQTRGGHSCRIRCLALSTWVTWRKKGWLRRANHPRNYSVSRASLHPKKVERKPNKHKHKTREEVCENIHQIKLCAVPKPCNRAAWTSRATVPHREPSRGHVRRTSTVKGLRTQHAHGDHVHTHQMWTNERDQIKVTTNEVQLSL